MYIIRGKFFGYFIASSYSCPFFLGMLLVQVPTPSLTAVTMLLVGDADIFTYPFRSPNLPLFVVVAFDMWHTFWRQVGKAIVAKFSAMQTVFWVDVFLTQLPAGASTCARSAAIWWRRTAW